MATGHHVVDIWRGHAITLVLSTQVQGGRVPLSGIARTVHRRCKLKKYIVKLERNAKTEGRSPPRRNVEGRAYLHAPAPAQVSMVAEWLQIGSVNFAPNNHPRCSCVHKTSDVESSKVTVGVYELNVSGYTERGTRQYQ